MLSYEKLSAVSVAVKRDAEHALSACGRHEELSRMLEPLRAVVAKSAEKTVVCASGREQSLEC